MSEPAAPSGFVPFQAPTPRFAIILGTVKIPLPSLRFFKRLAIVAIVLVVLLVTVGVPFLLSGVATSRRFPYRDKENAGLTPASLQLEFESVAFKAEDGVELKGWWVPVEGARGTVVLVHGLNRSRIEMVRKTPFLHAQGWNALLLDLRHHGESGGTVSTFGFFEKRDVEAAVEFARGRLAAPVVLWGVSLGGATSALAAADDPSISALICDSSYRSLRDTVWHHARMVGRWMPALKLVPTWAFAPQTIFMIGQRGGFDPDAVDIVAAVHKLGGRPSLFVCNSGDRRMPPDIAADLKAAAGANAELLTVKGESHGGAYRDGTADYEAAVRRLLQAVAAAPGTPSSATTRLPLGGTKRLPTWATHPPQPTSWRRAS